MSSTSLSRPGIFPVEALRRSLTGQFALAIVASLFVAACAHLSVPMPFTPVPTTMQPFAVLLIGMLLGPVTGCAAMVLYLVEGATGVPVFTPQGPGGVAQLLGPTAGYLFSYPLAAALAGGVVRGARRLLPSFPAALLAGALALVAIFSMGATWLGSLLHLRPEAALHLAVSPFLLAEALKLCAAAAVYAVIQGNRRIS